MLLFALAALFPTASTTFFPHGGNYAKDYSTHVTAIRAHVLLEGRYDKTVVPISARPTNAERVLPPKLVGEEEGSKAGTDVQMQLRFFKVDSVDPATGSMQVKVWLRMKWYDTRLAWNPADFGNVTTITANHPELEETDIWVPDIVPYNARQNLADIFDRSIATVTNEGLVTWSRPGVLDVMCKFYGLVKFPFDDLECGVDFGGWMISGAQQGIQVWGEGFSFTSDEDTSGSSYQEFSIQRISCYVQVFTYPVAPLDTWPVVHYQITLHRSSDFYVHILIWPCLLLTAVSFSVFFLNPDSGERLGYGVTTILAVEVMKVVIDNFVPSCGELLWSDAFTFVNEWFCFVALFESCFVLMLAYFQDDSFLPSWVLKLLGCMPLQMRLALVKDDEISDTDRKADVKDLTVEADLRLHPDKSIAKTMYLAFQGQRKRNDSDRHSSPLPSPPPSPPDGDKDRRGRSEGHGRARSPVERPSSRGATPINGVQSSQRRRTRRSAKIEVAPEMAPLCIRDGNGRMQAVRDLDERDVERLAFYESLFYRLDQDTHGYLRSDAVKVFLSYAAFDATAEDIDKSIAEADTRGMHEMQGGDDEEDKADSLLVRWEFLELCLELLWAYPLSRLEDALHIYHATQQRKREERKLYWRKMGRKVDRNFITVIIPVYFMILVAIFNVEFDDERYRYNPGNESLVFRTDPDACLPPRTEGADGVCAYDPTEMFQGIYSYGFPSIGRLLALPIFFAVIYILVECAKGHARRKHYMEPVMNNVIVSNALAAAHFCGEASQPPEAKKPSKLEGAASMALRRIPSLKRGCSKRDTQAAQVAQVEPVPLTKPAAQMAQPTRTASETSPSSFMACPSVSHFDANLAGVLAPSASQAKFRLQEKTLSTDDALRLAQLRDRARSEAKKSVETDANLRRARSDGDGIPVDVF